MHLGKALLEARTKVEKILEWQIRMEAADDVKFRNRFRISRSRRFKSFFERHGVSARRIFLSSKGAQPASRHTDVGWIDMAVDVEVRLIAVQALANRVSHPTDGKNITRAIKVQSVVAAEPFGRQNSLVNRLEPGIICLENVRRTHPSDDIRNVRMIRF